MSTYTVRPGDSLSRIAAQYNTTVSALAQANGIANPNLIQVGQKLNVGGAAPAAASSAGVPQVDLTVGSKGAAVTQLQNSLVKLGFMTQASMNTGPGVFGPRTAAAVTAFQKAHGVPATGYYGKLTRAALQQALAPRPAPTAPPAAAAPQVDLKQGSSGAAVQQLQASLVKLGYMSQASMNTGPGTFGPRTESALKNFQAAYGVPATGYYGSQSRAALTRALGGEKPAPITPSTPTTPSTPSGTFTKPPTKSAPSPNQNSRGGMDIDTIVLHHTASNNGAGDLAWMRNPASQVSAHYMVDQDGTLYQLVGDEKRAWHAGQGELHGVPTDVNGRSIGIEIVNAGDGKTPYTDAQYKTLNQLLGYLKQEYAVPMKNIVGHKDVAVPRGRKSDPSSNFDWARATNGI